MKLCALVQGDRSINECCQKMNDIADLLANINSPVSDKTLVTYMLNGLSPKFENISMLISHKDPLSSFLEACSTLVSKEFCVNRTHSSSSIHYDHGSAPQILIANNIKSYSQYPQHNQSSSNRQTGDSSNNRHSQPPKPITARYPPAQLWSPYFYPWNAYGWLAPPPWAVPYPP
ncbi:uncharacterized protein LOC111921873 [Lactuca sativa]|uniref:Uncharacterized protein n=1 Tax=Lactuca sativa TaxID=4236 RepID=A0A9R1X7X6_LACSA|nr:uncharacterized protein LOC111921873 [Lactuca sativa]KAJ0200884.1 hypothetical protein LSAT_V11C600300730 [Lactuca sativa]